MIIIGLFWWAQSGGAEWVKSAAAHGTSSEGVEAPTCSTVTTDLRCLWTSISFLCCILTEASATHQHHTANRHNTSFMLTELGDGACWGSRSKRRFSRRFAGNAECGASYLFIRIPEEAGKPLAQSWKAAETGASDE